MDRNKHKPKYTSSCFFFFFFLWSSLWVWIWLVQVACRKSIDTSHFQQLSTLSNSSSNLPFLWKCQSHLLYATLFCVYSLESFLLNTHAHACNIIFYQLLSRLCSPARTTVLVLWPRVINPWTHRIHRSQT